MLNSLSNIAAKAAFKADLSLNMYYDLLGQLLSKIQTRSILIF